MEVKELTDKIQNAVDELHKAAERQDEEIKKLGAPLAETKATIEKINSRIDGLEVKLQRTSLPGTTPDEKKIAHNAAFYKWIRGGKAALEPSERKSLQEDATGLYLIPQELEAEIIRGLPQINAVRQLATVRQINRDKVRVRSMTEVTVGWGKIEVGASLTATTPTPSEAYIYAEDLYALCKIGEDELQDTDANLQAFLADSFAIAIAAIEAKGFVTGRGHTTYYEPAGIAVDVTLLDALSGGSYAGKVATYGRNWTTDDVALIDDVLGAEYALPAQYLPGAAFLMNRKTELALRVLKAATTGTYLWQPALQVGQPNNFDGFPLYNQNDMQYPADTLAGCNIIFGNFKLGYMIVDRLGMTLQRLDELYAESGLVGFKVHYRTGGGIIRLPAFQLVCNDT